MKVSGTTGQGVSLALGVLVVLILIDVGLGDRASISGTYPLAAVVAAALTGVRVTAGVAGLAVLVGAVSPLWNETGPAEYGVRLGLAVALAALAVVVCMIRIRAVERLERMTRIADAAQRAILRPLQARLGDLGLAARYVSATDDALVGGDLYEAVQVPSGVRLLVGDVRGKGIEAVSLAAAVLEAFRRSAFAEADLSVVASDLDGVVRRLGGPEDFVTALLVEVDADRLTVLSCGHHPPLLVPPAGAAHLVDVPDPGLPLGIGDLCGEQHKPVELGWSAGSRLLLYTDGLVEARDRTGVFFDLEAAGDVLRADPTEAGLDALAGALVRWAGHRLEDDLALVLVEHRGGS